MPAADDTEGRRALKRLQEVGVHVLTPAAELASKPLEGAVAVMSLKDALAAGEPITAVFHVLFVLCCWYQLS